MTSRCSFEDSLLPLEKETISRSDIELIETETPEVKENQEFGAFRGIVLISYCFLTFVNGATWVVYSTIVDEAKAYYGVGNNEILWFVWQFNVIFLAISFPCSLFVGKSVIKSVILGSFVMAAGGWVRFLAREQYQYAMCGQCLISVSTALIVSAPNTIANTFFPEKERFFAIMMGSYCNALGSGFAYISSSQFVNGDTKRIESLLFISAIVLSISCVLSLMMLRPKKQQKEELIEREKAQFLPSLLSLIKNKRYFLANLAFSVCNSSCWSLLSVLDIFLQNNGLSSKTVGIICLILVLSGFFSSLGSALFLRYSANPRKHFDRIIKALYLLSFLAFVSISTLVSLQKDSLPLLIASIVVLGASDFGLGPFICEAMEEIGRPVMDSMSVNGFYFMVNLTGLPLGFISMIPALGNHGLWALTVSVAPFVVYVLGGYRT